jgi:sulfur-carrier protein
MIVRIPTALRSYTDGRAQMHAEGASLDELLRDLDRRHPGLRFRIIDEQDAIRRHVKLFVNHEQTFTLGVPLARDDEVEIVCALSGG